MLELFIINTTTLLRLLYIKALFLKKHLRLSLERKAIEDIIFAWALQ